MRYLFLLVFFLLTNIDVFSQIKPSFFPEDIIQVHDEEDIKCYCKPGVANKSRSRGLSLSYGFNTGGGYESAGDSTFLDTPSSLDRISNVEFKIKIPLLIKERTKILLGYQYYSEFYEFDLVGVDYESTFQSLDNNNLKKNSFRILKAEIVLIN